MFTNGLINKLTSAVTSKFNVHPTTLNMLKHFVGGSNNKVTLEEADIASLERALVEDIKRRIERPSYKTCTASSNHTGWQGQDMELATAKYQTDSTWFSSLAGAVGVYEWEIIEIKNATIYLRCWDKWDFNPTDTRLYIPVGKRMHKLVKTLASMYSISLEEENGELYVREDALLHLNKNTFTTEWETQIPLSRLELDEEITQGLTDPGSPYYLLFSGSCYCVPQWYEQQLAISRRNTNGYALKLRPENWHERDKFWRIVKGEEDYQRPSLVCSEWDEYDDTDYSDYEWSVDDEE